MGKSTFTEDGNFVLSEYGVSAPVYERLKNNIDRVFDFPPPNPPSGG
jgi:hypothetical protein